MRTSLREGDTWRQSERFSAGSLARAKASSRWWLVASCCSMYKNHAKSEDDWDLFDDEDGWSEFEGDNN